ncbi:peptidoglycan-binding protein [Streptomyces halstedii]|uniref:peptidoglycan-binding domain-containing protein n=1 Tax=Streptomyces halstedii TaxID=1944 RepID=UPI003820D811
MTGHMCPECGGDQGARPGCGCVAVAGTARQDGGPEQWTDHGHVAARTAEMAAAEDFDPLRIRPYVTLPNDAAHHGTQDGPGGGASGGTHDGTSGGTAGGTHGGTSGGPDTGAHDGSNSGTRERGAPAEAPTMALFLGDAAARGAAGGTPDSGAPGTPGRPRRRTPDTYAAEAPDPVRPRRRKPLAAIAVGAAVAAVVGTAAFASGLFGGDEPDEEALPEITTSVPDVTDEPAASVSASPSASGSPTPSHSASASPSTSASSSPSASPSTSASPSATASTEPPPSASASASPSTAPAAPPVQATGGTLRRGDQGPEVAELQRRLQEKWIYMGPDDAHYTDRVERAVREFQRWVSVSTDPPGVYGPETRRALEAETTGSGRPY